MPAFRPAGILDARVGFVTTRGEAGTGTRGGPAHPGSAPRAGATTGATQPRTEPPKLANPAQVTRKSSRRSERRRGWLSAVVIRPLGVVARCAAILLPLLLLAGGLVYAKLLHGPISVRFLAAPIARGISAELPGYAVTIEDAIVRRSQSGGVEFRLKNVRLLDGQGGLMALAGLAGIELSTRALRNARFAPSRIDLIEPAIRLSQDEQGRLAISLAEPPSARGAAPAQPAPAAAASRTQPSPARPDETARGGQRVDLARSIAELVAGLRRSDATAYLEGLGLRNASVTIEEGGRTSKWQVPELNARLAHRQKRSVLTAEARIGTDEPWTLKLTAEAAEKARTITLETRIDGLVPRGLAQNLTVLRALEGIDLPLSGTVVMDLDAEGTVLQARSDLEIGAGRLLLLPGLDGLPLAIDQGTLAVRYSGETRRFELAPSSLKSGASRIAFEGAVAPDSDGRQPAVWRFGLNAIDGVLAAPDAQTPPMRIERLAVRGSLGPEPGRIDVAQALLKLAGAEIALSGRVGGAAGEPAILEGRIGPMPVATLKAVWPASMAPRARAIAVEGLTKGTIKSGSFRIVSAEKSEPGSGQGSGNSADRKMSLTLEAADLEVEAQRGFPALEVPRALLRVEGTSLELTVPDASIAAAGNRRIVFKGGRATIVDLDRPRPVAEIAVRAQGPLAGVLDLLERQSLAPVKIGIPLASIEGKTDTQLRLTLPLGAPLNPAEIKLEGRARITEGRVKDVVGAHDITGASVTIDANDKGLELKGEMLIAGVLAKLKGAWLAASPDGRQPPLSITARVDTADRNQLGLDLDDLVQGEVPIELIVQRGTGDDLKLHVVADLSAAELMLDELQWRKPVGRPAKLEFDVGKGRQPKTLELQNFKVSGENIAVDGWVAIGPDNKPREYYFPEFSLNVVTNLEVQGTLRPDRVWDVKAHGKTFDARDLFRSFFAFGQEPPKPVRKNKPGIDLSAEIDTVLGINDTTLRQVKIKAQKRSEKLIALELKGTLEGGQPLHAQMRPEPGRPRTLNADTPDAGQALKLIGFYPNMVGGKAQVEIDLDGRGAVEKTGRIKVRNFKVLGDTVVAEVLQNADEGRPAIEAGNRQRRLVREQFDFERFDAAFAVGNAQLVIENAVALGPLIGASIGGKIDFKSQRMQLGGTYVPLSGLSRFVGQIPVIGQILTGPRGEGVLGITFAIQGAIAEPQVIVNPLSIVGLGIFREIFQMVPDNQKVTPRAEPVVKGAKGGGPQVRASPPAETPPGAERGPRADPALLDGWASSTTTTTDGKGGKKK